MKLSSNPFFILCLPCSAGRRDVVSVADELSFTLDPDICSNAQNELINMGKRLSAEISWFPGLDKEAILAVRERIEKNEPLSTDCLSQISKLNAILYNFAISKDEDIFEMGYSILEIDELYSSLDIESITSVINSDRETAKIANVHEKDVIEEINKKRDDIRQTISERLSALEQEAYIELITMLAEKCIADENYEDGVILEDVIDQYEIRIQSQLEESTEAIVTRIERIQHLINDEAISDNVQSLVRRVQKWDKLAQPLQLKSQASGIPHEISENLGHQLRNLALFLHNEKGKTKDALILVNAMTAVFAELEDLSYLFKSDSEALKELIKGEKAANDILTELDAVQKQGESLKVCATSTGVDAFVARVKKLDSKIKALGLDQETQSKVRENLCYMARAIAIDLHNIKHKTSEALTIAKALSSEFSDLALLSHKLNEDVTTLNQQYIISLVQNTSSHPYSASSGSTSSGSRYLIGIIIVVVIAIIIGISSNSGSSSSNKTSTSSSYSQNSGGSNGNTGTKFEMDELRKEIENMERRLGTLSSVIEGYESQLDDLKDDIDDYESRYYATGDDFYYNSYYSAVDEYNEIYEEYSDTVDAYNTLYAKYSSAIDTYNSKIR